MDTTDSAALSLLKEEEAAKKRIEVARSRRSGP